MAQAADQPLAVRVSRAAEMLDWPLAVRVSRAAEMLDCSRAHVYQLIERGELRRVQIAGSTAVRIPVADIYAVLGLAQPEAV